jgi:hypothetical protein
MALHQKGDPSHSGSERYELTLAYDKDDIEEIRRLTEPGRVVVHEVHLVWVRTVGGQWQRYTNGVNGSRAHGRLRLSDDVEAFGSRGQWKTQEIFTRELGEMKAWTTKLPDLRPLIEDAEANLPK